MQFLNLSEDDWQLFLSWATVENWRVSFQEQRLFQNQWRPYFFALHTAGAIRGFVSAVAYKESGWIGNLLVSEPNRGYGYGSALFDFALEFLRQSRLKRIWLTASETGQPIYQRRGFTVVDRVERWTNRGLGFSAEATNQSVGELIELDKNSWGESRAPLINALADDGYILRSGNAVGLLQPGISSWQLGPWLSTDKNPQENRRLLKSAVEKTAADKELLVDVLASAEVELILRACGFHKSGSNQLMVLCDNAVALDGVMGLASLGSIG